MVALVITITCNIEIVYPLNFIVIRKGRCFFFVLLLFLLRMGLESSFFDVGVIVYNISAMAMMMMIKIKSCINFNWSKIMLQMTMTMMMILHFSFCCCCCSSSLF